MSKNHKKKQKNNNQQLLNYTRKSRNRRRSKRFNGVLYRVRAYTVTVSYNSLYTSQVPEKFR